MRTLHHFGSSSGWEARVGVLYLTLSTLLACSSSDNGKNGNSTGNGGNTSVTGAAGAGAVPTQSGGMASVGGSNAAAAGSANMGGAGGGMSSTTVGGQIAMGGTNASAPVGSTTLPIGGTSAMTASTVASAGVASGGGTSNGTPLLDFSRPGCVECMSTKCVNEDIGLPTPYPPCSEVTGTAADGPAAQVSKKSLCERLFTCMNTSGCVRVQTDPAAIDPLAAPTGTTLNIQACYCGTAAQLDCLTPGAANGLCKTEYEEAIESTYPTFFATNFTNTDYASGHAAMFLVQCGPACYDVCGTQ